jgi:hypothetical protein
VLVTWDFRADEPAITDTSAAAVSSAVTVSPDPAPIPLPQHWDQSIYTFVDLRTQPPVAAHVGQQTPLITERLVSDNFLYEDRVRARLERRT